jgi:hypothetical protein
MEIPKIETELATKPAPAQVLGSVNGKSFYFRARYACWEMIISEKDFWDAGFEAAALYHHGEQYGPEDGYKASYMPVEDVEKFMSACLSEYLGQDVTWQWPEEEE